MSDAPQVKPGDWIKIGSMDAVVCTIRGVDPQAVDLAAVCNPERPAVYQVNWNGQGWEFVHPMRGVYAEHAAGVEPFVQALKRGWPPGPSRKGPK
jgi:hypothetical protein